MITIVKSIKRMPYDNQTAFFGQGDGMDWNKRILWCMHTVTILNPAAGLIFSANNGQVGKVGPKYIQMRTRLASFSALTYILDEWGRKTKSKT